MFHLIYLRSCQGILKLIDTIALHLHFCSFSNQHSQNGRKKECWGFFSE